MGATLPSVRVTGYQLRHLLKKHHAPWGEVLNPYTTYTIAQRKDGSYWLEARGSGAYFWMSRWYEIPKAAGRRIFKFDKEVNILLETIDNERTN